jgi:hypothetical protein
MVYPLLERKDSSCIPTCGVQLDAGTHDPMSVNPDSCTPDLLIAYAASPFLVSAKGKQQSMFPRHRLGASERSLAMGKEKSHQ